MLTQIFNLFSKNSPQVSFHDGPGPSGRVIFRHDGITIDLYREFGGGDVLAIIDAPTPKNWPTATGTPLEKRAEILNFIGKKAVEKQTAAGRGRFEVQDNCILIFSGN